MKARVPLVTALVAFALSCTATLLGACRSKECVPGREVACACPGGEAGAQTCDAEGARYLPCVCASKELAPAANERAPAALPKTKKLVRCGGGACDTACCATFDPPTCTREPAACPRTPSGEGVIFECDGPEDCGGSEACCLVPGDRTIAAVCVPSGKCSGQFEHPRYKTIVSPKIVCHVSGDCGAEGVCSSANGMPGLSTCK